MTAAGHNAYEQFAFRVMWDGRYVAGVNLVSALARRTEVVEHRSGGDPSAPHRSPGLTRFDPVVLRRGVTVDLEFEQWAAKTWRRGSPSQEVSLHDFRKDILLHCFNEAHQLTHAYTIYRCWVSEYQALADLDAGANAVAIEMLRLENEGWERDYAIEQPEPSATLATKTGPKRGRSRKATGRTSSGSKG